MEYRKRTSQQMVIPFIYFSFKSTSASKQDNFNYENNINNNLYVYDIIISFRHKCKL